MAADRFGAFKVIVVVLGAVCTWDWSGMAHDGTPLMFSLSAGLLIGMAQAGTTYAVIYGVIGRNVSAEKRSWAMGVAAAAGSFGQFLMVPTEGFLITQFGWQAGAGDTGSRIATDDSTCPGGLREPGLSVAVQALARDQSIAHALSEAFKYPSFQLLMAGYFVCGFQVVFIGVHMPSYLRDKGLVTPGCQLCVGTDWIVQRVWYLCRWRFGPENATEEKYPGFHLHGPCRRHQHFSGCPAHAP
jgi:nitrate/nitrite transporter NarK